MAPTYRQKIRILRLGENSYEFEDALVNRELTEKRFDSLSHFHNEVLNPYELKFKIPTILKNSHKMRHFTFACSCTDCPFTIMLSTTKNFGNTEFNIHDSTKEFSGKPSQSSFYSNTTSTAPTTLNGKSIATNDGAPVTGFSSFSVIKPAISSNKVKKQDFFYKDKKSGNNKSSSKLKNEEENIFEGEGIKVRLEESDNDGDGDGDGDGGEHSQSTSSRKGIAGFKKSKNKQQNADIEDDEDLTDTEDEERRDIPNLEQNMEDEDVTKQYGPFAVTKILLEHNHSVNPNVNSIEGLKEFILIKIPKVLHDDLKFDRLLKDLFENTVAKDLAKQYGIENTTNYMGKDNILKEKSPNTTLFSSQNSEDKKFKIAAYIRESGLLDVLEKKYVLKPTDVLADKAFSKSINRKITTYKSRLFTRLKKEFVANREKMISEQLEAIQQETDRGKNNRTSNNGSKKGQKKRKSSTALDETSSKRKQPKSNERKENNLMRVENDESQLISDALNATESLGANNIDTSLTETSPENIDFVLKNTRHLTNPTMVNNNVTEQNTLTGIDKHQDETLNDKKTQEAWALLKSHTEAFATMNKKKSSKSSSSKHSKKKKKKSSSKHNTVDDAATAVAAVAAVEAVAMNSDLPLSDHHIDHHIDHHHHHHHHLEDTEGMPEDLKNVVAHLDFMDSPLKYRSELEDRSDKNSETMMHERGFDHHERKNEDIGELVENDDNIQPELKM
ncbi:hypothetical protein ACO0RG_001872 [Hanseniaspora osmophila]|uniref:ARS-binding factor 1 n=1 Tax=Hanseniaspora osmophila TaxID=56408 RepID=A0A1E5RGS6_9ASCO|nr:ARS-binding factor 1 [Hanseniaspora osmophila]